MTKSVLSAEFRKLSGLVSLTERSEWNLKEPSPAELVEADKVQMVTTKLKGYADTLMAVSKELSQKGGTPMEFYSVAGTLLSSFAEMLAKGSGDKDLAKTLNAVAGKLTSYSEANRHTNSWHAVPTDEALTEIPEATEKHRDGVVEAMARALFVTAWADAEEEAGNTYPGEELMDVAPKTSAEAKRHAEKLAKQFEQKNGMSLDELLAKAAEADDEEIDSDYAREFGHYLAMQAMGHGVSWFDDHEKFPLKVPHTEFYL